MAVTGLSVTCSGVNPYSRIDCGYGGITPTECVNQAGCCYDDTIDGVIWCFIDPTSKTIGLFKTLKKTPMTTVNLRARLSEIKFEEFWPFYIST